MAADPQDVLQALRAAALFVVWPGMLAASAFVLLSAIRLNRAVHGQPVGRLVLLMVVGSLMTWAALAGFATVDFAQRTEAAAIVLPLFLVWAGSMVLFSWIMHRWGAEAVRLARYHQEVAQMDRMKAQIINNVAHELNTPLTPIRLRVASIQGGGLGPVSERQAAALGAIERNLDRVDAIVGRMVLALRLQAGKVHLSVQPTEVRPLLLAAVDRAREAAREKDSDLQAEAGEAQAMADADRLATVLDALLSNAVKFTPAGGRVLVRAATVRDRVRIEVQDTGVGMAAEALDALFEPLRPGRDEVKRTEAGAGLGLAVAKALVELHGGTLAARSPGTGLGSTFTVELPAAATQGLPGPTAGPTGSPGPAPPA